MLTYEIDTEKLGRSPTCPPSPRACAQFASATGDESSPQPATIAGMESRCVSLLIHGRVQGVFYRAQARVAGADLGLRGWVRNCDDGTVEARACGSSEAVEQYIAWCHHGPPAARVRRIEIRELAIDNLLGESFDVRR